MKKKLFLGFVCLWGLSAFAQEDIVLMQINGKQIFKTEFEDSYRRYVRHSKQLFSPKEYAEFFIQSKLKVEAARDAGLDTTSAFRKQQEKHRTILLESSLVGKQAMDSCARALYQQESLKPREEQIQVLQIFKYLPQTITSRHLEEEKRRMDSLYQAIKSQPDIEFSHWMNLFSEDKRSRWIKSFQTTSEFENMAFSLAKGEVSQPFFAPEGIYIIKVTDRKVLPVYETFTQRIQCAEILHKGTEAVTVERLKKEWNYQPNQAGMDELLLNGATKDLLFTINGQAYTGDMFDRFASSYPHSAKRQLDGFITKSLFDYEAKFVAEKSPQSRQALRESDEKYLIAEITRQRVDLPSVNDRAGLTTYFKFHSSDYRWESPRFKGVLLHCADKKIARQAKKILKKTPEAEWADKLRQTFNTLGEEKIKVEQDVFADGQNKYIDKLVFKKGDFSSFMSHPFTIAVGEKQKGPSDYREVIDHVQKDYRSYLSASWERELREKSKVEIKQEVLKTVNNN